MEELPLFYNISKIDKVVDMIQFKRNGSRWRKDESETRWGTTISIGGRCVDALKVGKLIVSSVCTHIVVCSAAARSLLNLKLCIIKTAYNKRCSHQARAWMKLEAEASGII